MQGEIQKTQERKLNRINYIEQYMIFLMYHSTQLFYDKRINATLLVFVYCVEVLLHVSTLSGHHQAIII
jgi:hypothetical protein